MAKAINMRPNQAKTAVAGDLTAKFNAGQSVANERKHPTDGNKGRHTTDDGTK